MKYFLLFFLLPFYSNAQKVEQYCNAIIGHKFLSQKIVMSVDYGDQNKLSNGSLLQDSSGKELIFNSEVDALNYLGRSGWKIVDVTSVTVSNNATKYYLFKKEMDASEFAVQSKGKNE